jgi:hypothetical protein
MVLQVIKICCSKIIIDVIIEYISKINSTMQTEALFENIAIRIQEEIQKSKNLFILL